MTTYRLGDIAKVEISGVDKKIKENETEVLLCNFINVYHNWNITKDCESNFMKATANKNEIAKFSIHKGQVALTKDSETRDDIGVSTYIADDFENVLLGYHCALVTPDEKILNGNYLNCLLNTKTYQRYFENNASGSGQRFTLSVETLNNIPLSLPPIDEQEHIAKVLSDIDSKIALNKKINRELETMAKEIYDYWFVQFCFPNEEGKPYKSSGGKMQWNDVLKREIPAGWEVKKLGEVLQENGASLSPKETGNLPYTPIDQLPKKQMSFAEYLPTEEAQSSLLKYHKYDILIGSMRVYFHRVCIAPYNGITRTTSIILKPIENKYLAYLYEYLFTDEFIDYATKMSNGSQQPCLSWSNVKNKFIVYPPETINDKFSEIINPIIDKVINTEIESLRLQNLRDELLPLLMNGQVMIEKS